MENFKEKLKVVIATIGKAELAKQVGFRPETLTRKIKNPGLWKLSEMDIISDIYNDVRELPVK